MNEEFWRWYMYGHWVCLTQWLGFIMVEYAYLGKGRVKHPLVWSGVITMLTMTLSVVHNYGFFTPMAVALTLLFLFITVMLFGGTPGQKFTACLINGTMCLLVENSMRYVISWILKCELQQVIQRADCLIIIAVANMVVGAAVAFLVGKWRRRNALEPLQALTMSFFPGVVVVLNILLMLTDNNKRATMATMGMTVGLTVAVMVHLCIVAMFNDQVMQRRSLYFQAELEQQRASALLDSYTAQRRLTHEFTNHISALRALLEQGDVAGAQDYIAGVDKAVAASTTIMDTHNPLLDSILTRKYEEATRQGVSVYFDLCDLRNFPLSGVDMVTVLANLLDNAICAAAQAYPPEGVCAGAQNGGGIPSLGAQPGAAGCGAAAGWAAAPHHPQGARPRYGAFQRAGCSAAPWCGVYPELPGQLVPLYLCGAHRQFMTSAPSEYDSFCATQA